MNELMKQIQPTAAAVAAQGNNSPACFNFFDPVQFDTMQRVCKLFANSDLVPDMYKATDRNPEAKAIANCMIAIEISQRIGASPLMIMQNMVPIYGRPSWSSKFLISTVNTCGRFNPLRFRFTEKGMLGNVEYTEYSKVFVNGQNGGKGYFKNEAKQSVFEGKKVMDIECVAWTTARGSDEILESSPITLRLAIQEGWYLKAGSKWQTMPRQMLMYRAASFWTNAYAPELSMGMKTVEEQQDIYDITDMQTQPDATKEVADEKAENANKETIGFDNPQKDEKAEKTTDAQDEVRPSEGNESPLPGF